MSILRTQSDLRSAPDASAELELASLFGKRDPAAVRLITERYKQRLFRAAWGILGNSTDAEDAVQAAYLRAFEAIASFEGRSTLSTWLTRIVINEALQRKRSIERRRKRLHSDSLIDFTDHRERLMNGSRDQGGPEHLLARKQMLGIIEGAIKALPDDFRAVFLLREVEGLSNDEVAEALDVLPATVKTRMLRARRRLQKALEAELRPCWTELFPFAGVACASLTARVLAAGLGRIAQMNEGARPFAGGPMSAAIPHARRFVRPAFEDPGLSSPSRTDRQARSTIPSAQG